MIKPIVAVLAAIPLSACISFGAKPPTQLLTLTPTSVIAAGSDRSAGPGGTMTVSYPAPAPAIVSNRIPVYDGPNAVAYVKDALWIDSPSRQFQRVLAETIGARTGRIVVDLRQSSLDPGVRLNGTLAAFGIDATKMEAVVTYDGVLVRSPERIETRRFERRAPVAIVDPLNSAAALNQAANAVAADVAAWVGR